MFTAIVSFLTGVLLSAVVFYIVFSKRESSTKEELIKLKAKIDASDNMQEIIKRDFVRLANETIKN